MEENTAQTIDVMEKRAMPRPKIMIVDDDERYLELLDFMLTSAQYDVVAEGNPKAVQKRAEQTKPDIIILDMAMPELDGIAVGLSLKSEMCTRDIPVIYVTAMSGNAGIHEAMSIGAVKYLTKPFTPAELINAIRHVLAIRAAEGAKR
jgi:CheY-like chemotaxis protein